MPLENQVEVFHKDGNIIFRLSEGGYCIKDGKLAASIETERLDGGDFPACANFCIFDFPVLDGLKVGTTFKYKRSRNIFGEINELYEFEDKPKAHAYFQFHVSEIEATWTILDIKDDEILFSLEALHDDIDAYAEHSKPAQTRGLFRLRPVNISELWIP